VNKTCIRIPREDMPEFCVVIVPFPDVIAAHPTIVIANEAKQ
jgi:hypothetical protein